MQLINMPPPDLRVKELNSLDVSKFSQRFKQALLRKPRQCNPQRFLDFYVPCIHEEGRLFRLGEIPRASSSYVMGVYGQEDGSILFSPDVSLRAFGFVFTARPHYGNVWSCFDAMPALPRLESEAMKTRFPPDMADKLMQHLAQQRASQTDTR